MTEILNTLLNLVALYGYPVVALTVFIGYLGIPVPSEGVLMAAGALTLDGGLNFYFLIFMVSSIAISGDILAYYLGRKYGIEFIRQYGKYVSVSEKLINDLGSTLQRWGVSAIFLTRWLLTPLGIPMSLLSGTTKYSFKLFLSAVVAGEILWVTIYVYLGYFLGSNWPVIYAYLENFIGLILTLSAGILLLYLGYRVYQSRTN